MLRSEVTARGATAVLAVLVLAACSAAPGAADVKEAMRNNAPFVRAMEATMRLDATLTGTEAGSFSDVLDEIEVEIGQCANAAGASGSVCDFRVRREVNGETLQGRWTTARFFKAGDQWQFEQAQ